MPGLDPGIHQSKSDFLMDRRVKPGDDALKDQSTRPDALSIRCIWSRCAATFSGAPTLAPAFGSVRAQTSVPAIEKNTVVSLPIGSTTSMLASKVARFFE